MTSWLSFPLVVAPSADDRTKTVCYSISNEFIEGLDSINRRTPILQLWTHVVGKPPPVNLISRVFQGASVPTLQTLGDAVACFQGVKRPHVAEEDGDSVLIYVLNPLVTIVWEAGMACIAKAMRVPKNTVLTVQVCTNGALLAGSEGIHGVVTRLEYISSSGDEPTLPVRYRSRYLREKWRAT
jgi:hypothetical protein